MGTMKKIIEFPVFKPARVNASGYLSFRRSWREQYCQLLLTNTMSNTFYIGEEELAKASKKSHEAAADEDPFFMAKAIVYARAKGFMRLQPIYGLVVLSGVSPNLFERIFPLVIRTAADLSDFLMLMKAAGRGQGGRVVKRVCADFLNRLNEYAVLKYNGQGRGFSLSDMVRVIHPKPVSAIQSALFAYSRGLVAAEDLPQELSQFRAYEALKMAKTEGEAVRFIKLGRLPHNIVTGTVKMTSGIWEALLKDMPLFALIRHLSVLERHGLVEKHREWLQERVADKEAIKRAMILPQRYVEAYRYINTHWLKDALRLGVEKSVTSIPDIKGKTAIFLDRSGSMEGKILMTAATFAFSLYKKTCGDCLFMLFNTKLYDPKPSLYDSIISQAERIEALGGTDTSVGIRHLLENKIAVDNIIIITDEEQNAGSSFNIQLSDYRRKINSDAKVIIVNVSPYANAMNPPEDELTFYVYGWSDAVVSYVANAANGYGTLIDVIENEVLPDACRSDGSA